MPKYLLKRGVNGGRRCCLCGRQARGLLFGKFGLCRKCWRDGMQETLVPCLPCSRRGIWVAMDDEEQKNGCCRKCFKSS